MNIHENILNFIKKPISKNIPFQLFTLIFILVGVLFNIQFMQYVFPEQRERRVNSILSILVLIMVYWTYILAALTKPYQSNYDSILTQGETDLNITNFPSQCDLCKMKKFERSSHCAICERCVLRRDHHCTWLGNCIGFSNTRFFVNFLMWFLIGDAILLGNYIRYFFYLELEQRSIFNQFSWLTTILFYLLLSISITFGSFVIQTLMKILIFIYNDITFVQTIRIPNMEIYNCCIDRYNAESEVNLYNKGFIFSFYTIIGPTILHLLLPLPVTKKYEIIEYNPSFGKILVPNAFDIYRFYVKNNEIEKIKPFEESLDTTSPSNFIELSKKYYNDKIIK